MDFFKKHADTVTILGAVIVSMLWMNHKFNAVDGRFANLEKEVAIIKTVLIMKNIMPESLAKDQKSFEIKS